MMRYLPSRSVARRRAMVGMVLLLVLIGATHFRSSLRTEWSELQVWDLWRRAEFGDLLTALDAGEPIATPAQREAFIKRQGFLTRLLWRGSERGWWSAAEPDPNVVVIGVFSSDTAQEDMSQSSRRFRIWSDAVDRLHRLGAKVVVLDMFFPRSSGDEQADATFASALDRAGNVVFGCHAERPLEGSRAAADGCFPVELVPPFEPFAKKAAGLGHVNVISDSDQVVRRIPAAIRDETGDRHLALCVRAAQVAQTLSDPQVRLSPAGLRLGSSVVSLNGQGTYFYAKRLFHKLAGNVFTLSELRRDAIPASAVREKCVVIGHMNLGSANTDVHATPTGREFGCLIQASAISNLLDGWSLREALWYEEIGVQLLVVLIGMLWFSGQSRWTAVGMLFVAAVLLFVGGFLAYYRLQVLFPVVHTTGLLVGGFLTGLLLDLGWWRAKARRGGEAIQVMGETGRRLAETRLSERIKSSAALLDRDYRARNGVEPLASSIDDTVKQIMRLTGANAGFFAERRQGNGQLELTSMIGMPLSQRETCLRVASQIAEYGKSWISSEKTGAIDLPSGVRDLMGIPVLVENDLLGVFAALNKHESGLTAQKYFEQDDLQIASAIAFQGLVAHQNYQLARMVQSAHLDTVLRLSIAAEYRDKDTGHHIQRIREYAAVLARTAGLESDEVDLIRHASAMHDIGKLAVPDSILCKPGKLTPEERLLMEQHTVIGARMLAGSSNALLQASEVIAISHHERFDGAGYPYRIAGKQIPLYGRIVAVVDVFDALCSKRCYKEALSVDQTLIIMREQRGKQFDPELIDAFLACLDTILEIRALWTSEADGPRRSPSNAIASLR